MTDKINLQSPFNIIIPARYQSNRLPGKLLMDLAGKPIIQHVVEHCNLSDAKAVVVATDDNRIIEVVEGFGGKAVLTSDSHPSGSDRVAEACEILNFADTEIIVNVQGDEPDMPADLINQVAAALVGDPTAVMATASANLDEPSQATDPSVVKVVTDIQGYAIYFSRATIPWVRDETTSGLTETAHKQIKRHLGIYSYTAGYIREFASRENCILENLEKLEQLRCIWHGEKVRCVEAAAIPGPGVDTQADLDRARKIWQP